MKLVVFGHIGISFLRRCDDSSGAGIVVVWMLCGSNCTWWYWYNLPEVVFVAKVVRVRMLMVLVVVLARG